MLIPPHKTYRLTSVTSAKSPSDPRTIASSIPTFSPLRSGAVNESSSNTSYPRTPRRARRWLGFSGQRLYRLSRRPNCPSATRADPNPEPNEVVFIAEARQIGYLPAGVADALGWFPVTSSTFKRRRAGRAMRGPFPCHDGTGRSDPMRHAGSFLVSWQSGSTRRDVSATCRRGSGSP